MFTQIRSLKIYYEVLGTGNPILLLHGWGGSSLSMRSILQIAQNPLELKAYAMDLPGFGYSDMPSEPWGIDNYANCVLEFLDHLGLDKVDILGHSFGGRIAIKIAAHYPKRIQRLILVDSAGIRPKRGGLYYARVYFAKSVRLLASVLPAPLSRFLQERILSKQGSSDYQNAGAMRQTFVKVVNEDLLPLLNTIKAPTLLIWGESDKETPLSDAVLMKLILGSSLAVLNHAGHFSYLDDPQGFAKAVKAFLKD